MINEVYNQGAVELSNNWIAIVITQHVEVSFYYLRELKDHGLLLVE